MDLIIINAQISTMDKERPWAEAVAVYKGKIAAVGSNEDILKLAKDSTQILDLEGKMLLPGFNDSHMHLLSYGTSLQRVDLFRVGSIEEIIKRTSDFIEHKKPGTSQWVQGIGWNQDYFNEKRFPTKHDLDKISKDIPLCITRACYHVAVVNSRALELAGITGGTAQVEGGHFDIDDKGEPTGIFRENAVGLIYRKIPEPSIEEIKNILAEASNNALREGITSIQTDDFEHLTSKDFNKIIRAYKELIDEGRLSVKIYEQCLLPEMEKLQKFIKAGYMTGQGNEHFRIGPLKLLADGSLGARTAYMTQPYADDSSTKGISVYTQEKLDELVKTAHSAGMHVAVHCIGDKAMYMALESIEKAQRSLPRENCRHSIVHCQITDKAILDKFKAMDIVAHIQPIFLDYDLHIVENRVGKERALYSYNWKGMTERGIHVAMGSDCPVEYFSIMKGLYCAINRKDLNGFPEEGWLPEQRLTVDEALYDFTMGGAYASFEENVKGSITPGKFADIVVLSDNLYKIDSNKIKDVKILMTFVDGKLVYKNEEL